MLGLHSLNVRYIFHLHVKGIPPWEGNAFAAVRWYWLPGYARGTPLRHTLDGRRTCTVAAIGYRLYEGRPSVPVCQWATVSSHSSAEPSGAELSEATVRNADA